MAITQQNFQLSENSSANKLNLEGLEKKFSQTFATKNDIEALKHFIDRQARISSENK